MQARYTPVWMPVVIVILLLTVTALFATLVSRSAVEQHGVFSQQSVDQSTQQKVYQWKMVTTWPKKFPGLGLAPENFAEKLNKMSNGRLQITVHGANEIVPALGVFDAVSSGSVEMGHSAAYYWKGKIPAAPFFTAVPFGMNAQEFNGWLHYGGGLELWRETYEPYNLIPFAAGNTGVQMGGWFNKEINSLDDIKGLKMRIPGLGGEVFTRAGGTAVNIPGGELYTSLQSGVIDATEWVGPYNDLAFGFHQIAQYYYYPGWHEPGPTLEIIVNKDAYNSLPEDLQVMIEVAARMVNQDMLDEYTARNNSALVELVEKHGVDVRPFPDDVLTAFKQASVEVYEELADKDPHFAKVYRSYMGFLKGANEYLEISEKAYLNKR
ncbi:TRAP transporter substrate-binding protein [Teredinibacter sp. KSP-S5-2]|uniref:TRAP transporter substrate-binding protein n=1 Tax=Teredinibacter sp. KSP-S5-2 TaxID=3034506 RepID=UPI0029352C88|nr:TRAP transporter substrate-binding protein [Teredinibacter sp. KSP-S5-2]WNO09085.1 TRAP transporter substrate-binding protein [Teredinibacter sp. KSP-S5-2]